MITIGLNITEKIISNAVGKEVHASENIEYLPIHTKFINDPAAPQVIQKFNEEFLSVFDETNKPPRIHRNEKTFLVIDHLLPLPLGMEGVLDKVKQFAKKYKIKTFGEYCGIEHALLSEEGIILPGEIVVGTDSHTASYGALGAFGFGVGVSDMACALATGHIYDFDAPKTIKIILKGKLRKNVYSKDVIMHVISQIGEGGCSEKVAEFEGEVIDRLSMDARQTITNMAVEMSARSSIINPDSKTLGYIKPRTSAQFNVFTSDEDASYSETRLFDLSNLEPQVAKPYSPANSVPVSEVQGTPINKAFIGSCTNGRAEDLKIGARVLKGKRISEKVEFFGVVPATKRIYEWAEKNGTLEIYKKTGAQVYKPSCALCFGVTMKLGPDDVCISTINRNYYGRSGHPDSEMYLASPATVAASALYGKITDPREVK